LWQSLSYSEERQLYPYIMNFNVLPSLVALAILVAVFRAILRQRAVERLQLWLTAWILVLIHFVAQFFDVGHGLRDQVASAISLGALELASIAFLISMSPRANDERRQLVLAAVLGLPALAYTTAVVWEVRAQAFYFGVVAAALLATSLLAWKWYQETPAYLAGLLVSSTAFSAVLVWLIARNHPDFGINAILAGLNFVVAFLYWHRFRRVTAGVLTTVFGFIAWGSVFPIGLLLALYSPSTLVQSETWNIPKYFVAVGMILTLLEEQVYENEHLAYHDALTGLPNRRLLEDRLEQALAHAARAGNKVAVLLIDLDRFKEVNDTFGHRIGDLALQQVVLRLSSRMRASDTLARSGGDEFTVVSDVSDEHGADILISGLESALAVPLKVEGHLIQTGMSIGVALYPDQGHNPDELRAAADHAMYQAKRGSRTAETENVIAFPHSQPN
jgi:diguanylate cyclase (GGDEF)-like protein